MKIYDLISHRSYDIQPDWIDFELSRKDSKPIVNFSKTMTRVIFYRIFLKKAFKENTPNKMGILAVSKNTYKNALI